MARKSKGMVTIAKLRGLSGVKAAGPLKCGVASATELRMVLAEMYAANGLSADAATIIANSVRGWGLEVSLH